MRSKKLDLSNWDKEIEKKKAPCLLGLNDLDVIIRIRISQTGIKNL